MCYKYNSSKCNVLLALILFSDTFYLVVQKHFFLIYGPPPFISLPKTLDEDNSYYKPRALINVGFYGIIATLKLPTGSEPTFKVHLTPKIFFG